MPVMNNTQSVAANASVANVFAGSAFEFARAPSLISLGITQSATGLFVSVQNGSDIVAEEFEPYIATTPPIIPDHMYYSDISNVGDRFVVKVRNSTAGALTIRSIAQISFLN